MNEQDVAIDHKALADELGKRCDDFVEHLGPYSEAEFLARLSIAATAIHHDLARIAELLTVMCDR